MIAPDNRTVHQKWIGDMAKNLETLAIQFRGHPNHLTQQEFDLLRDKWIDIGIWLAPLTPGHRSDKECVSDEDRYNAAMDLLK